MTNNINTTKEQERAELHRAIWQIANDNKRYGSFWRARILRAVSIGIDTLRAYGLCE